MTEREKKYLSDILESIELIESFCVDIQSFGQYSVDLKTKSAVERQLGIIGEAVNKLKKHKILLNEAQLIISFRNRLIHAYDSIDDTIVWVIIKKYISPLKKEVVKLIQV